MSKMNEFLKDVSFTRSFESRFMKPMRLTFDHGTRRRVFDLALSHCSVATLLYHTQRKQFLIVRQFRPAVFVGRVSRFLENEGKSLEEIDFTKYPTELGYTVELCAGLVDKDLPIKDIAREEIEEECGYKVPNDLIHYLATYTVDADESGSTQWLFYAEIDDSMKISEGGGNIEEGENITKVFLSVEDARRCLDDPLSQGPPGVLYALLWWFQKDTKKTTKEISSYQWAPREGERLRNLHLEPNCRSNRYHPARMRFTLDGISRLWDMAPCEDSVAVFLYKKDTREAIFTQRFRPAVLVGRTLHLKDNKGKLSTDIEWDQINNRLAYTVEMCSTHNPIKDQLEKAIECVRLKLGYNVKKLQFVTSFIAGISQSGERERMYYGEVDSSDKIEGFEGFDDVIEVALPISELSSLTHQAAPICNPGVLYMTQWFLNRHDSA